VVRAHLAECGLAPTCLRAGRVEPRRSERAGACVRRGRQWRRALVAPV